MLGAFCIQPLTLAHRDKTPRVAKLPLHRYSYLPHWSVASKIERKDTARNDTVARTTSSDNMERMKIKPTSRRKDRNNTLPIPSSRNLRFRNLIHQLIQILNLFASRQIDIPPFQVQHNLDRLVVFNDLRVLFREICRISPNGVVARDDIYEAQNPLEGVVIEQGFDRDGLLTGTQVDLLETSVTVFDSGTDSQQTKRLRNVRDLRS